MSNLEPKPEKFCQLIVEGKSKAEAYRQAFPENKMKNESLYVEACKLAKDPKISLRIEQLRAEHRGRHNLEMDDLLAELEEARQIAKDPTKPQPSAMVAATMGKAKLLGLDKQVVELSSDPNNPINMSLKVVFEDDGETSTK